MVSHEPMTNIPTEVLKEAERYAYSQAIRLHLHSPTPPDHNISETYSTVFIETLTRQGYLNSKPT